MGNNNSTPDDNNSTCQEDTEYADLSLMLPTLELLVAQLEQNQSILENLLKDLRYDDKLEKHRNSRVPEKRREKRKTFTEITHTLTNLQFRRMFRMTRQAFTKLCTKVGDSVGDDKFKSEHKIRHDSKTTKATLYRGGDISGEVRLATYLRLMAGASYLDLFMIYDIKNKQIYNSFNKVARWINDTFTLPLVKALQDKDEAFFEELSEAFGRDSNGVYIGCFGAVDGLAVKIKRPTVSKELPNPGAYYCRKGFYALNCQAICDVNKRVLWISSRHIGSCHDSRAFTDTGLYCLLLERKEWLKQRGFFIAGDSAYNMESFLLIPYEQPAPQSSEDAYNFWQSNSRIRIECCFGELVMRFGVFWRTLKFDLKEAGNIINSAALLHNFILEERMMDDINSQHYETNDEHLFRTFSTTTMNYLDESMEVGTNTPRDEAPLPTVSDNNEPLPTGRHSQERINNKAAGKRLRDVLRASLALKGKKRPTQQGFKTNSGKCEVFLYTSDLA